MATMTKFEEAALAGVRLAAEKRVRRCAEHLRTGVRLFEADSHTVLEMMGVGTLKLPRGAVRLALAQALAEGIIDLAEAEDERRKCGAALVDGVDEAIAAAEKVIEAVKKISQ